MSGQPSRLTRGRNVVSAVAAAVAVLAFGGAASAATPTPGASGPTCTVDFSVSDDHPAVGQNITLTWSSSGADELIASWTTAHVPPSGTQVTTEHMPGPVSYQVTGLASGQYCGGAVVNVVYAAVVSSSTPAPPVTSSSSVAPPTPATTSASPSAVATTSAAPSASPSITYPAQSPTGGSSTPWYEQPLNLAVIGVLSLFGSIALFNRERFRAVFLRRH